MTLLRDKRLNGCLPRQHMREFVRVLRRFAQLATQARHLLLQLTHAALAGEAAVGADYRLHLSHPSTSSSCCFSCLVTSINARASLCRRECSSRRLL